MSYQILNYIERAGRRRPSSLSSIAFTVLLLIILGQPQQAQAQTQWTTSTTNSNDIYKTSTTGNLGIGTTTPGYKLHIVGDNTLAGGYPLIKIENTQIGGHAYWLYSGANGVAGDFGIYDSTTGLFGLIIKSNSNVGIGTVNPAAKLEIKDGASGDQFRIGDGTNLYKIGRNSSDGLLEFAGTRASFTGYRFKSDTGLDVLTIPRLGRNSGSNSTEVIFGRGDGTASILGGTLRAPDGGGTDIAGGSLNISAGLATGNALAGDILFQGSDTGSSGTALQSAATRLIIKGGSGNIGIGTVSPTGKLEVATSVSAAQQVDALRVTKGWNAANAWLNFQQGFEGWRIGYAGNLDAVRPYDLVFMRGGATPTAASPGSELFRMTTAGNVGIGTPAPGYKLDVNGIINATAIYQNGSPISVGSSQWTPGTGNISYSAGNVGIGTPSPAYKLDVVGTFNATTIYQNGLAIRSSQWMPNDANISYSAGNVGIGGAAVLDKKLKVTGDMLVTGNMEVTGVIYANYQDVAEWVPSTQALAAATVVVLDPDKTNQVLASTQAYDTRVAGVVSVKPGIALGERGEGKVLVATTGRVKVKVDATRAPIHVGDLLVTSEKEGVAMKSVPLSLGGVPIHRPGTLIGKALEPLEKGTGEILVLLSLQ